MNHSINHLQSWTEGVAQDCREYAAKYQVSLSEAVTDWEGDGPDGSWGLAKDDQLAVAIVLGIGESFGIGSDPYEY